MHGNGKYKFHINFQNLLTFLLLLCKKPGIDGQEFQVVMDTNEFSKNAIVSVGSRQYGPRWYVIKDPQPWNTGYIYTMTLVTDNPTVDFVSSTFLLVLN
jgi:hypothetical protein